MATAGSQARGQAGDGAGGEGGVCYRRPPCCHGEDPGRVHDRERLQRHGKEHEQTRDRGGEPLRAGLGIGPSGLAHRSRRQCRANQHERDDLAQQAERARAMGTKAKVTVHPHDGHAQAADRRTARHPHQPRRDAAADRAEPATAPPHPRHHDQRSRHHQDPDPVSHGLRIGCRRGAPAQPHHPGPGGRYRPGPEPVHHLAHHHGLPRHQPQSARQPAQPQPPRRNLTGLGPHRLDPLPPPGRQHSRRITQQPRQHACQSAHRTPRAATRRPACRLAPARTGAGVSAGAAPALASPSGVSRYRCRAAGPPAARPPTAPRPGHGRPA